MDERSGLTVGARTPRGRRSMLLARGMAAVLAGSAMALAAAPHALAGTVRPAVPASAPDYPASVEINSLDKPFASGNNPVTVKGTVRNTGKSPLKSAHAAVRVALGDSANKLRTRNALAHVAAAGNPSSADGVDLPNAQFALGDLAPGQSQDFTLTVTPADLKLKESGVYELAVDVWDSGDSHCLGIGRTFLPYTQGGFAKTNQLAVVWPITHAPELVAQTMPDSDQTSVLRDDSLAKDLAQGGRLFELVNTGTQLPNLTWAIDPDLLDTVYAMTKPYRVQKPNTAGEPSRDDNTVPGAGTKVATDWLAKLRQAVTLQGSQVVALPYADPDLASIAHNGADQNTLNSTLRKAVTAGQVTAEGRLSTDVRSDVAWPYQGVLDQRIAATAQAAGGSTLLVNGASLSDQGDVTYTPNAAHPLGNGQTALVADGTLSELLKSDPHTPQETTAIGQRLLGETMVINLEQPNVPRSLLVLPPRSMTAGTAKVLADSLAKAHEGGWLDQVNLNAVAQAPATPKADISVPTDYPKEPAASEISSEELARSMSVQGGLDRLMQILTQPQRVRGPFSAAMVRSMSTGWRDQGKDAEEYRKGVSDYLDGLDSAVKVPTKSVVTLPGDNATLLISVKNDLTQPVGNLQLRLTSGQLNRLRVATEVPVALDGTTSKTFRFPAQAQAPGSVTMTAQLWTTGPNPQPYGAPVTFTVDVTSVTNGVVYVIAGGAVLIALAGLRFYLQRKKQAAHGDTEAVEAADDPEVDEPSEDAEIESAVDAHDRVGSDEKVGH